MRKIFTNSITNKVWGWSLASAIFLFGVFLIASSFSIQNTEVENSYPVALDEINGQTDYSIHQGFESSVSSFAVNFTSDQDLSRNHYEYRSEESNKWSTWRDLEIDGDFDYGVNDVYSKLHFLGGSDSIEVRMKSDLAFNFSEIKIITFSIKKELKFDKIPFLDGVFARDDISVIPRYQWGADESLRYYDENNPPATTSKVITADDDWMRQYADEIKIVSVVDKDIETGNPLIWPFEYTENIEKIIIHHSAGRTPSCSEEKDFLKSIYRFHTITRGWGDIGYNYIVGPCSGEVYQGRAGGYGVKGAHAGKFNAKTIGIMVMGDFQNQEPPQKVIQTLGDFSRILAEKYGFWPDGSSKMRGQYLPNIVGHRDVMNTSCPGAKLFEKIPDIINIARNGFIFPTNPYRKGEELSYLDQKRKESFSAEPVVVSTNQIFLKPGEEKEITVMFKNMGSRIWNRQTYLKLDGVTDGLWFLDGENTKKTASLKEATVAPNLVGSFRTTIKAEPNLTKQDYIFKFIPVINGVYEDTAAEQKYVVVIIGETNETNIPKSDIGDIYQDYDISMINPEVQNTNSEIIENQIENIEDSISIVQNSLFIDVDIDNIFYSYIEDLKSKGIVNGNNGYYYPEKPITRGEISKILVKASGIKLGDSKRSFLDIANNTFEEYIRTLQSHSVVSGQDGNFQPFRYVTRAEAVKMLVNVFGLKGTSKHIYKDMTGSVFESYVQIAQSNGVIGSGTIFDPDAPITRDQVAKIVSNALKISGNTSNTEIIAKTETNIETPEVKNVETPVFAAQISKDMPIVRLDLNFQNELFKIKSNQTYALYDDQSFIRNVDSSDEIEVSVYGDMYRVLDSGKTYEKRGPIRFISGENGVLEVVGESRVNRGNTLYNHYRGNFEIRIDPDNKSKLYVINELPLEDYLAGLGEEPDNQPEEKIKTVLVMARSYIEYYRNKGGKFPERKVDLKSDGGTSQLYLGYDFEMNNPKVVGFVKETWGEVITYNDSVIRAPYFSQSGGHTITPGTEGNNWNPASFPFAIRVEDPWSCGKDLKFLKENGPIECAENQRGHGVGLSAYGAKEMALSGMKYKDILRYYLTGIEFKKMY